MGVVVYTYSLSPQNAAMGGSGVLGQPGLHIETLFQKNKTLSPQDDWAGADTCLPSLALSLIPWFDPWNPRKGRRRNLTLPSDLYTHTPTYTTNE